MLRHALLCIPALAAPSLSLTPTAAPRAPAPITAFEPAPSGALAPTAAFGAPCLCFPLRHEAAAMVPENALEQAGWNSERLAKETLAIAQTCDDPFARAEALRRALLTAQRLDRAGASPRAFGDALLAELEANLKRETELAPLSRAILVPKSAAQSGARSLEANELALYGGAACQAAAVRSEVAKLDGVARVELHPAHGGLVIWYDAARIGTDALAKAAGYACEPQVRAPDKRDQALAAVTLAFAARAAAQSGLTQPRCDPSALAAKAAALAPRDARILLVAGMVAFDQETATSARYAQDALKHGRGDALAEHNLRHVFGVFFDASSLEELDAKLSQRLSARG